MADAEKAERVARRMAHIREMLDEGEYEDDNEYDALLREHRILSQWLVTRTSAEREVAP